MKGILISAVCILILGIAVPGYAMDPAARDMQVQNLKAKDWQIRWYAASALGEEKEAGALEPLIDVMKNDDNGYVRAMAAWALGEIGDVRAVEPLIAAITDESHDVQNRAPLALKQITGQDFGPDADKWAAWWKENR